MGRGKHPVINVSWDDAKAYTAWISCEIGKIYRLLSETEWEYVTRAGTTTPFWRGSAITPKQANYDGNHAYASGSKGEYRKRTMTVDSFEPNPWGPYQVHGNVWEWTEDCWFNSNTGNFGDGRAWTTGECYCRVIPGGRWSSYPLSLRSTCRVNDSNSEPHVDRSFRVARTLNP